jgi:hypothetical protein
MGEDAMETLVRRALFWIGTLEGLAKVGLEDGRLNLIARAHFATLALEHLGTCCELLTSHAPDELAELMRKFVKDWEELRNVLEHEEEYILGGGRQRKLFDPEEIERPPTRGAAGGTNTGLMNLEIYGRVLDFAPHVSRANAMKQSLLEWLNTFSDPAG